jgi:hypothetical protein
MLGLTFGVDVGYLLGSLERNARRIGEWWLRGP